MKILFSETAYTSKYFLLTNLLTIYLYKVGTTKRIKQYQALPLLVCNTKLFYKLAILQKVLNILLVLSENSTLKLVIAKSKIFLIY